MRLLHKSHVAMGVVHAIDALSTLFFFSRGWTEDLLLENVPLKSETVENMANGHSLVP